MLADLQMGARLFAGLPRQLRRPLRPDQAREILRRRQEWREADFLDLARRAVFAQPQSPYRALLRHAGCDAGDLERLVAAEGVEGALAALYRSGVYLTSDEVKGRQPAMRGGLVLEIDPARLCNPLAAPALLATTSGSRGRPLGVPIDLAAVRDRAVNTVLTLAARGDGGWRHAVWGTPGLAPLLWYSLCGGPAARWFSQLNPAEPGVHPRYRWSARALWLASRLAAVPLPALEPVPLGDPLPIARWMAATLRDGGVPHLWAFCSSAVRLCRAASVAGIDLTGARLTVTGEPFTASRLEAIRGSGAEPVPDWGMADSGGPLSHGCLAPRAPDEVHFFDDLHALVHADGPPFPPGALLITSLRPTAPLMLLNVATGDCAQRDVRPCGCPLEELGWRTHLRGIRSYEKLTAAGMSFLDTDVIRVLEQVLPQRFGGGPTDYQLVEWEGRAGEPALALRVAPAVGPLDAVAVAEAFREAIGAGSPTARVMALQWRDCGLPRVERAAPLATASGKILHLRAAAGPPGPSRD